ncbi:hypothetical protein O3P69_008988 [Scylla paramamosain]|uniref:Uncharacterized protein n=1 Tax=Scylla paramamosain TaxID=85552 RepID=A0AAW0TPM8_SCYPA
MDSHVRAASTKKIITIIRNSLDCTLAGFHSDVTPATTMTSYEPPAKRILHSGYFNPYTAAMAVFQY